MTDNKSISLKDVKRAIQIVKDNTPCTCKKNSGESYVCYKHGIVCIGEPSQEEIKMFIEATRSLETEAKQ